MLRLSLSSLYLVLNLGLVSAGSVVPTPRAPSDPCASIAGQDFVVPADALACLKSFPFNETLRQNVLTVVSRVFDFFTFEDFYLDSPPPFQESTANIRQELARINSTEYATDFDFNKDLYDFTTQLNDGHTRWFPSCYTTFQNLLPAPVAILEEDGEQGVFIAPDSVEFFDLAGPDFTGFFDSISFDWQRLAGAKVLSIEGMEPFDYIDLIARTVSGNFLDHGVRVNSVLTSYRISGTDFSQRVGDLAGPPIPTQDNLTFSLITVNGTGDAETVTVPFLATFLGNPFTDQASFWENNCVANGATNGVDLKGGGILQNAVRRNGRPQARAAIRDVAPGNAIGLPQPFLPTVPPVDPSAGVIKSFILPDGQTGVMFVGSFEGDFLQFQTDTVNAMNSFLSANVSRLLIDLTNNGGGFVCLGQFLHQFLAGSQIGYPGFESTTRANELAQKVVASDIALGVTETFYSPINWAFLNDTAFSLTHNFITPSAPFTINGVSDPTSQRFHDICTPFDVDIPEAPLIPLENVAIVSNGNCASTCAMFSTLMNERHNTTIAVFGGKPGEQMEFKGMAGNQVLEWSDIDTEIKTANLKNDPLAPPDLLIDGDFRHNWRTAWSFLDESTPIAYLSELPKRRFAFTKDTFNNPQNLWTFAELEMLELRSGILPFVLANLLWLSSACTGDDHDHGHFHSKRAFPTGPITAPTRPLVWGDVNVIHSTDTHGWLLGHQKASPPEPNYSGDFGDFASFVTHMKQIALEKDVDLLLVDTGDLHDGTGLSDGFPPGDLDGHDSNQFIKQLPYDVLTIGNHELSDGYSVALDMFTDFAPFWKGRYLTSNVNITIFDENQNPVSVPIGERFVKFTTRKGRRVTSLGVLFDFTGNAENTTVQKVENMVKEQWFQDAIADEPDFFLLIGHMPVARDKWPSVFDAIRAVHPTTPILIFGGHSHIRDCLQFDGRSMSLESGRYMETIGWMSVDLDERNTDKTKNLTFTRRYLDQNRVTYEFHTGRSTRAFDTLLGRNISAGMNELAQRFDLSFQFGTAPHDFLLTRAPFPSNDSLLSLFIQEAAPVALAINNSRAGISSIMITNSGSQRFDVLQGPFTKNDQFTASPFSDSFLFIPNVPAAVANQVLPSLNQQGAQEKRAILEGREEELYKRGNVDARYFAWLKEMAERDALLEKRALENLTLGYITKDACPGFGDDVPHTALPFFSIPDFIGSVPPNVTDDTPIDLVFVDFIETQLLGILNSVSDGQTFTTDNVMQYSPVLANQVLGVFAQAAWN
ncbi:hypothetical protein ACEPAH_2933 [Sanghuangporus vaninii]